MVSDVKSCLVTVMAGYVHNGRWTPLLLRWIRALRSVGNHLVLVFDQDDLSVPPEFETDDDVVFLARRHQAYDFGSYRLGVQILNEQGWLNQATHVLLCNDSVIGPFSDLSDVLLKMMTDRTTVWGLTEITFTRLIYRVIFFCLMLGFYSIPRCTVSLKVWCHKKVVMM